MVARPCLEPDCDQLATDGPRCPNHRRPDHHQGQRRPWYDDPHYRQTRSHIQATATTCHACGLPFTAADPVTVDHVPPVATVTDWRTCRLLPAHRSCNSGGVHHKATPPT